MLPRCLSEACLEIKKQERTHMRIADKNVTRIVLECHGFTFKKSFEQAIATFERAEEVRELMATYQII